MERAARSVQVAPVITSVVNPRHLLVLTKKRVAPVQRIGQKRTSHAKHGGFRAKEKPGTT